MNVKRIEVCLFLYFFVGISILSLLNGVLGIGLLFLSIVFSWLCVVISLVLLCLIIVLFNIVVEVWFSVYVLMFCLNEFIMLLVIFMFMVMVDLYNGVCFFIVVLVFGRWLVSGIFVVSVKICDE